MGKQFSTYENSWPQWTHRESHDLIVLFFFSLSIPKHTIYDKIKKNNNYVVILNQYNKKMLDY